jgi:hypothetical protein
MGPSDKAVEDVLYQKSVLGRAGDVKELKAAYLVRFLYAALSRFALSPLIHLPDTPPQYLASNASTYTTGADLLIE